MFNNIGRKIMGLARFLCWLGIIASIGAGIFAAVISTNLAARFSRELSFFAGGGGILAGIMYALIGSLISWLSSLVLYGFGQLVDDTAAIRAHM